MYIITSPRLKFSRDSWTFLPCIWLEINRKQCACRQIRANRLPHPWALEAAALEPLGAHIGCARATRHSNRRSKSLEIAPRAHSKSPFRLENAVLSFDITRNRPRTLCYCSESFEIVQTCCSIVRNHSKSRSKPVSKIHGSKTLDSVVFRSDASSTMHGYAWFHSSIYIYIL